MKRTSTHAMPLLIAAFAVLCSLGFNSAYAQQAIGAHPTLDAGFESQASGNVGSTQSATAWSFVSSGSTQSRGISITGGNGGPKYISVGRGNTTSNSSTTINSNQITTGSFLASTNYIVQFHYRQTTGFTGNPDTTSFVFISSDGTAANRKSTRINLGTPPANWTLFSTIVATDATSQVSTGTCGINIKNQATPAAVATTIDVDNFVVYPADNQAAPAPDVTAPGAVTGITGAGNPAIIDLSWTAPASGIDGGGYMVVRFTADPAAEPAPVQNAVYRATATNTIGTTGTVVYVGPASSFSDGTTTAGVSYWYRVYTVDKAFNYSPAAVAGPFVSLPKLNYYYSGTGSTADLNNWWTNKNATGTHPANFTAPGQIFRIVTNADLVSTLAITGTGSTLIIGDPSPGVPAMTVNFNSASLPGIDTLYQSSDGNPTVLNFNTSAVPSINQLFDIFTQVHYRAPGISVGTSKTYDKIFVENNADVIFTGNPVVTTSFQVDAGATATLGTLSSRYLTVNAGATATINGKLITPKVAGLVSSNVGTTASTFGAIQFIGTGDVVLGPQSTIEYAGVSSTTTQTITPRTDYANMIISGVGTSKTFTGPTTLSGSLTMNTTGATGAILSGGVVKVNGDLILTAGYINSDATNILELGPNSSVTGGSNTSYVAGPMKRNTAATTAYLLPVGKGGSYAPLTITPIAAIASVFQAEYINAAYSSVAVTAPLTSISTAGYWNVTRSAGGANATVALGLSGTAIPGATNTDELVVARYDGTSWVSENVTPINPGDATTGTAVSGVISSFAPFTFGVKPSGIFPVKLISFNGMLQNGFAKLSWTVAQESGIRQYVVEQSNNGRTYEVIGTVNALNSGEVRNYSFNSNRQLTSNTYYRLKIAGADGTVSYSGAILIKAKNDGHLNVGNSLVQNHTLNVQLSNLPSGQYELRLVNINGQSVKRLQTIRLSGTQQMNIALPNAVSAGIYVLQLAGNNIVEQARVVIQ